MEEFRQGSQGVTSDAAVHYVDWDFKLEEIFFNMHVFHGTEDHLVPLEFGQYISKNVPNCELHIMKGEGHLFPYKYMTLIFDTADEKMAKAKH